MDAGCDCYVSGAKGASAPGPLHKLLLTGDLQASDPVVRRQLARLMARGIEHMTQVQRTSEIQI